MPRLMGKLGSRRVLRRQAALDVVMMSILIMVSGNPAALSIGLEVAYVSIFLLFIVYWKLRNVSLKLNKLHLAFLTSIVFVIFIQYIVFGDMVVKSALGFLVRLLIAVLAARVIRNFHMVFANVMVWIAALGVGIHSLHLLGVDIVALLSPIQVPLDTDIRDSFGIHTVIPGVEHRNCGMFWEPGAFAGYIVVSLFLIVVGERSKSSWWKVLILLLADITTLSTTGYVVGFVVFLYWVYLILGNQQNLYRYTIFPLVLIGGLWGGWYAFQTLPFLQEKIQDRVDSTSAKAEGSEINRFGNFVYDLSFIAKRPIFGWGTTPYTKLEEDPYAVEAAEGQGNGLSGFYVKFGVVIGSMYFYLVFRSLAYLIPRKSERLLGIAVMAMALFGEQFLNYPLFLAFAFAYGVGGYKKRRRRRKRKALLASS